MLSRKSRSFRTVKKLFVNVCQDGCTSERVVLYTLLLIWIYTTMQWAPHHHYQAHTHPVLFSSVFVQLVTNNPSFTKKYRINVEQRYEVKLKRLILDLSKCNIPPLNFSSACMKPHCGLCSHVTRLQVSHFLYCPLLAGLTWASLSRTQTAADAGCDERENGKERSAGTERRV